MTTIGIPSGEARQKAVFIFEYGLIIIFAMGAGFFLHKAVMAENKKTKPSGECVVLLHGIAKNASSMKKLEAYLKDHGYRTVNFTYPSTTESIEALAGKYLPKAMEPCRKAQAAKIHFVTHSMGGIVVRQYLQNHRVPEGSRMVMLAPPNKGSEVVDSLKGLPFYKWIHGPAGQELGTDSASIPNRLKPVNIEVGVIAGDSSINPIFSAISKTDTACSGSL